MFNSTHSVIWYINNITNVKSFFNNQNTDIKFLNKSCAPRATATPSRPSPAIIGPILFPVSKTATIAKKLLNILEI